MKTTMIFVVTFLAPSFEMDLPSTVIHKPKYGLLGSWGLMFTVTNKIEYTLNILIFDKQPQTIHMLNPKP